MKSVTHVLAIFSLLLPIVFAVDFSTSADAQEQDPYKELGEDAIQGTAEAPLEEALKRLGIDKFVSKEALKRLGIDNLVSKGATKGAIIATEGATSAGAYSGGDFEKARREAMASFLVRLRVSPLRRLLPRLLAEHYRR